MKWHAKKNTRYSQEDVANAILAVEKGKSVCSCSRVLRAQINTIWPNVWHAQACRIWSSHSLQHHDEQEIVLTCQVLAEMGFGVTRKLVEVVVADYVRENNILTPFTDGKP